MVAYALSFSSKAESQTAYDRMKASAKDIRQGTVNEDTAFTNALDVLLRKCCS
jgi:hypothetical protein